MSFARRLRKRCFRSRFATTTTAPRREKFAGISATTAACLDFRKSSLLMSSPIGQSPRQRTVLDSRAIGHASRSLHSGEGLSGLSRYHDESAEVLLGVMHFPFMWDYEALLG